MMTCQSDNSLSINMLSFYGKNTQIEISQWPNVIIEPAPYYGNIDSEYIPISLILSTKTASKWAQTIPPEVASTLIEFEQIWHGNAYLALYVWSRLESVNSVRNKLGLFRYVFETCYDWHPDEYVALFNLPSVEMFTYLDLPAEKEVSVFFRRLKLWKPSNDTFSRIKILLKSGLHQKLSPLGITGDLIYLIHTYPDVVTSKVIQQYNPAWEEFAFSETLGTLIDIALKEGLSLTWVVDQLSPTRIKHKLMQIEERLDRILESKDYTLKSKPCCTYPIPHFHNGDEIDLITNSYELYEEAKITNRELVDYHEDILEGRLCLLRIQHPERCTILLSINGGAIIFERIYSAEGDSAAETTVDVIREWLYNAGISVDAHLE